MARRKTLWTPELVRQRIRTTQLLKRVQDHVLNPDKVKMKPSQVKAALFLISRMVGVPNENQDLTLGGNLNVLFDNPVATRPEHMNGNHRRPLEHD